MGGQQSKKKKLKRKEIRRLEEATHFSIDEVERLYEHFRSISESKVNDGLIDKAEFQAALGLKDSVFADRIFKVFDENSDGAINFQEFLMGFSQLCHKGTLEEKLAFSFRVYDVDGDGHIDEEELFSMLKASLFENLQALDLTEQQLRSVVRATFEEADTNGDGLISLDEYSDMVRKHPNILANLTLAMPEGMSDGSDAASDGAPSSTTPRGSPAPRRKSSHPEPRAGSPRAAPAASQQKGKRKSSAPTARKK